MTAVSPVLPPSGGQDSGPAAAVCSELRPGGPAGLLELPGPAPFQPFGRRVPTHGEQAENQLIPILPRPYCSGGGGSIFLGF